MADDFGSSGMSGAPSAPSMGIGMGKKKGGPNISFGKKAMPGGSAGKLGKGTSRLAESLSKLRGKGATG